MRPALFIVPLLALTACATPREQCINDVTRQTRILGALISETQGNIARGYAITEEQEIRTRRRICRGHDKDGETFHFRCDETETTTKTVPVAIDLNAEQDKLKSLEQRFAIVQAGSNQAVAQCIAIHPE